MKIFKISFIFYLLIALCVRAHSQTASNLSPKNHTYIENSLVNFCANEIPQATQYRIQLCSDAICSNIFKDSLLNVQCMSLDLGNGNAKYYWRNKVFYGSDSTDWSEVFEFVIYNPYTEPSLLMWISADSIAQLDNSPIALWNDVSQNTYNASQSDPSKQPIFKLTGGLRNRPCVDFNGAKGLITQIGNVQIPNNSTLGFVSLAKNRNQTNFRAIYYLGNGSGLSPSYAARSGGMSFNNGSYRFWGYNGSGFSFDLNTPNSTFKIISGIDNNVTANLYSGGSLEASSSSGIIPVANAAKMKIGCDENLSSNYDGILHELFILKNGVDTTVLRNIENYLDCKFIPRADLGGNIYRHNGLCDSTIVLNPGAGYASYLWSTGETTPTITITEFGDYWVQVVDELGYTHFDKMEYKPYLNLGYPQDNFFCANGALIWDSQMTGYTVTWSDNTIGAIKTITEPGIYSFTLTDGVGCTYTSASRMIVQDDYPNTAYLGADTSLCTGNPIALQVGAAETVSYAWQGNAASSAPSFAVGGTGNYWVESVNVNGCVARDTIFITNVGTAPIAQFLASDHCKGLNSGIVDQSTGVGPDNVVLWHWNLGNGTELSQQTVNYTYPLAGNYPIELYVQSAGGCGAYHYDTVQVFETPQADFNFIGHCQGQEVLFTEGAVLGGAPISSYSWNFDMPWMGAYNTSTINIPNRIFDEVGTYDVVLQVTDGNGCQDAVTLPVVIDPTPVANYVFESTCQGSPIQFLNTSVTQASSTYLWDFGDNTSSILVNPAKTFPDYGIVPVELSVTNLSGCTDTVLQNVQVFAFPLTSLQIGPACMDSYATLENTSTVPLGAIDSTIWILNQTDTLYGSDAAWMVNAIGQQQVDMFTWSDQGCMSQTSQFFDVNEQFNASFTIGPGIVATGQPFVFENTTNTASVSLWNFDDGGFSTDFSPVHTFDAAYTDSTLAVLLIALSPSGCVDSTTQEILIQRARIDLEITNLFLQKENAWYIMGVKLKNKGTVNLESAQLVVETTKGLLFNETWNGTLKPTEDSIYVFSGMPTTIFTDQDLIESYICVSGLGFDLYGNAESYLENNNVCRNIEGEGIVLLPVYPNPVYEDFTARIYVTKEAEVTFELTDDRGRVIENFINAQTIAEGYYDYTVNTDQLSPGVYFLKVRSNDTTQSSKLIFIRK